MPTCCIADIFFTTELPGKPYVYIVPLCLTFTETAKLFCKPAAPFYIPIENVCVRVPISVHLHQHLLFSGAFFNALQ